MTRPSPTPAAKALTILEVLESAAGYLGKHRVDQPRLNAEHLLAHVLGKKRIELYLEFDRPLGSRDLEPMRVLIRRRGSGEPLQHLLGTVEFHGRIFKCDARALVPRPETERLVELLLARPPLVAASAAGAVLDVGAGSGVIALTIAAERPAMTVAAVDASADALALARENAEALALAGRVQFIQSDLLAEAPPGTYDLIVANLPYVPSGEIPGLAREVRHDPLLALDGGADGLALIRRCVADARARLRLDGCIALEIGHNHAAQVIDVLKACHYRDIRAEADYQGVERFVFATYGSR